METKKAAKEKTAGVQNTGFMKALTISPALAKIVGNTPLPRTEVTKKLWEYIKKNNLQDPENKRNIRADDNLREIFGGKDSVSMFEMTKLVSKHLG
jgi:chromatin remodeling complex protein RSC6